MDALESARWLTANTFLKRIEIFSELPSTNDLALQWARSSDPGATPCLILAHDQRQGRGRGGHVWMAAPGALTFSILIESESLETPDGGADSLGRCALRAGLAICDTLSELAPQAEIQAKWPNDVWLNGKKVAGVLMETVATTPRFVVIGIGINVHNDVSHIGGLPGTEALRAIGTAATSIAASTGIRWNIEDVLRPLVQHLDAIWFLQCPQGEALVQRWSRVCALSGKRVRVASPPPENQGSGDARDAGICRGIDASGTLLIESHGAIRRIRSGSVTMVC